MSREILSEDRESLVQFVKLHCTQLQALRVKRMTMGTLTSLCCHNATALTSLESGVVPDRWSALTLSRVLEVYMSLEKDYDRTKLHTVEPWAKRDEERAKLLAMDPRARCRAVRRGMTQAELAEIAEVTQSNVSEYERGMDVTDNTRMRISHAVDSLIERALSYSEADDVALSMRERMQVHGEKYLTAFCHEYKIAVHNVLAYAALRTDDVSFKRVERINRYWRFLHDVRTSSRTKSPSRPHTVPGP